MLISPAQIIVIPNKIETVSDLGDRLPKSLRLGKSVSFSLKLLQCYFE